MKYPHSPRENLRSRGLTLNDVPNVSVTQRDAMLAAQDLANVFDAFGTRILNIDWTNIDHCKAMRFFGVRANVRGQSWTAKLIQVSAKWVEVKRGPRELLLNEDYSEEALGRLGDCIRILADTVHRLQPHERAFLPISLRRATGQSA